jgi:hypothetical protein
VLKRLVWATLLVFAVPAAAEEVSPSRRFEQPWSGEAEPKAAPAPAKPAKPGAAVAKPKAQQPATATAPAKGKVKASDTEKEPATEKAKSAEAEAKPEKPLRPDLKPAIGPWRWKVTKTEWSEEDERGFEEFVRQIGDSECATVHDCLTSPVANPRFHDKHPPRMTFFADCADLPFILRGYYAWQAGLPFSFSVRLAHHPRTRGHTSRLSGFQVSERYDIVGPGPDPRLALPAIYQFVSSEHFRTPPAYTGRLLADHYPVVVSREGIRPGTVIFDPDGHLAVVYKVTDDGRAFYIDAHPDNSLTRGLFNREFARAEPPMGAGFKRWRPQRLEGATKAKDGTLSGGRIVLVPDAELPLWSDEQFFGNRTPQPKDWKDGVFVIDGQTMDYHEYVRLRLAYPGFKYDPVEETRTMLRQLCRDLRQRVDAVQLAVKAGLDKRPPPGRLPLNIYATQGDWEVYSTPSRDARIKTAFEELRDEVKRFLKLRKEGSTLLAYSGSDLRRDLLDVYRQETESCPITYARSDGSPMQLSFAEVKRRLFLLSFDPYHCIERRWGASSREELAACRDDALKTAWYVAEQRLRNQLVRTYGEKMGWSLAEMQNKTLDIGIVEQPDVDTLKVLEPEETNVAVTTKE